MRFAELGTVYRYEPSGTLHGLLRVRGLHPGRRAPVLPAGPDAGGDRPRPRLLPVDPAPPSASRRPRWSSASATHERRRSTSGSDEDWEAAESTLAAALEARGLPYERIEGEAVFYGPKIDIKILDALGRALAGLDHPVRLQPARAVRPDLRRARTAGRTGPYMVHRALYGSIERFFGAPDRALRRRLARVAGARPGDRHPHRRPPPRLRPTGRRPADARRGSASRSTSVPRG